MGLSVLITSVAIACQVPVFRYALERWPADQYELIVLHDKPLSAGDNDRIKQLRASSETTGNGFANFTVTTSKIGAEQDIVLKQLWEQRTSKDEPLLVSLYPRNAQEVPDRIASVAPLRKSSTEHIATSPVRQRIVDHIADGDSAVWIFVPSGNKAEDAKALATLKQEVARNEKELELPPQEEIEADEFFSEETKIELRLSFSIVTLDRDDPKEQFLLDLLLESEPDLRQLDQPMAFPVLGRGRILYALVGPGISRETIAIASTFIVGPCSCQVKEQNPGFDLLLSADWDERVGTKAISKPIEPRSTEPVLLTIPPGRKK